MLTVFASPIYLPKQDLVKLNPSPYIFGFVKGFEGLNLTAYKCPAGVWTIGWGHTKEVTEGMRIDLEQAELFLHEDLNNFASKMRIDITVPLTQNQFDALV
ncbi:MAG: hypothetical protein EZS28_031016, partial [Streblomastix strix]